MIETGEGGNRESQVEPGHSHEPVKLSNSAAVAGVNLFWREVSLERENLLRAWERRSLFRLANSQTTAVVRFLYARTRDDRPSADERLPFGQLVRKF